ncbi:DUF6950 family protein [Agrobacterium tumefaciens]|uniref:DUF6950 family protein n=1 Tax=Agrobacterium tumefaciens TaxID=358 RepID=UPI001CBF5D56|nr:hypothetical protein [Agrobacterium tumefaciens]
MDQTLSAFLDAYREKPWRPGHVDCCLFLASWAIWLGHRDPAEHLRGTYEDEAGFRSHIEASGSVVSLVGTCAAKIHGKRMQSPYAGSIGVIGSSRNIYHQFGAIFDGERWLVRFINGVGPMVAKPLAIWAI